MHHDYYDRKVIQKMLPTSTPAPRRASRPANRSAGFGLIELMVTITIAAILLGLAVPSMRDFIMSQRVKSASYDIVYTLNLARSEAIKRNATVTVAPAATGWKDGWSVTIAAGASLSQQAAYSGLTIIGPAASVSFGSDGRLTSAGSPAPFEITGASTIRCVSINLTGLAASRAGACS